MNEYPDELRALLDLTRDAHDPTDPEARTRVRHALTASLLISGGAAGGSVFPQAAASNTQTLGAALKGGKAGWALFGSKLGTVALGAVTVAGLSLGAYHFAAKPAQQRAEQVTAPAHVAPAFAPSVAEAQPVAPSEPAVEAPRAVDPVAPSEPVAQNARQNARNARSHGAALPEEMALLRAASEALGRGDEASALERLREYGRRFPDGSLREERDGLRAIAECTRDDAPSSASAKRFLRQYPSSLLAARVSKACAER